jgi:hypothetical protein
MAHYAFINEDNIVVEVIVGKDENELIEGLDTETYYGNYKGLTCKRTSYNGNIRGTYAGIGFTYNEEEDIFIAPQPFPSWNRVGSFWEAPVAHPIDGKLYAWNEETGSWNELS